MNAQLAGKVESGMLVELNVSLHLQQSNTHVPGPRQSILQQLKPIAFALVVRVDADGPEGPGRECRSVGKHYRSLGEHYVADNTAVFFHYEIQLRNESWIVPETMQHKVLLASGTVHVPECLAGEVLHLPPVTRFF